MAKDQNESEVINAVLVAMELENPQASCYFIDEAHPELGKVLALTELGKRAHDNAERAKYSCAPRAEDIVNLCKAMAGENIVELICSSNNMGDEGLIALLVNMPKTIKQLHVAGNNFSYLAERALNKFVGENLGVEVHADFYGRDDHKLHDFHHVPVVMPQFVPFEDASASSPAAAAAGAGFVDLREDASASAAEHMPLLGKPSAPGGPMIVLEDADF